jgi:hypothetical protein
LCGTHHAELDQGYAMTRFERVQMWEDAHRKTIAWLFENGHIEIKCAYGTPTQLTLANPRLTCGEEGWLVEVTEKWIPGANIRKDLFGWIDLLALRDGETLAVQTTSWSNVSARVHKITESDTISAVRKANWNVWVVGWKKDRNRWVHKVIDLS